MEERYYKSFAAANILGHLRRIGKTCLADPKLFSKGPSQLTDSEMDEILSIANELGIKTYHFKRTDRTLPRVHKVMGFLKGITFENLLDVGSGRGVFLLPFMDEFPRIQVTSIDILDKRIEMLTDLQNGGIENLTVKAASICDCPFPADSFDVVTLLEVLEHIPDVESAIRSAVSIARQYIIVTVPSKEDSNPEHIHLLTKEKLTQYFTSCGVTKLSFDGVPGHLFMIARKC